MIYIIIIHKATDSSFVYLTDNRQGPFLSTYSNLYLNNHNVISLIAINHENALTK